MAEHIDLVNDRGEVQATDISRGEYNQNRDRYPSQYMQIVLVLGVNALGEVLVHERSHHKSVDPGKIDKICETVQAGETPLQAAVRGVAEESALTVSPDKLVLARAGVNEYQRYRTLYGAILDGDDVPTVTDPNEVAWVRFMPLQELVTAAKDGTAQFVDGFFTDVALAVDALRTHSETPLAIRESLDGSAALLRDYADSLLLFPKGE